jgi:hypothetical protein
MQQPLQHHRPHLYQRNGNNNSTTRRPQPVSGGTGRFPVENATTGGGGRHYNHNPILVSSEQPSIWSDVAPSGIHFDCVYVYGLPTQVTTADITRFFAHASVLPDKVHVMLTKFDCPIDKSYCEFGIAHQAHIALVKD